MRLRVTIEGRDFDVEEVEGELQIDGAPVRAEMKSISHKVAHLLLDGRSHTLLAERSGRGLWSLHLDGRRFAAEVTDERTRAIRELAGIGGGPRGPKAVSAPMPGLVLRVEVEPGQSVAAGQGVVIIEAMKMENELKAEAAGVVSLVRVSPGQPVEKGAVLVEFEAPAGGEDG